MDKFLNIKRKVNDYDENNGDNKRKKTTVTETIKSGTQSSGASRKYHDNYLNFGFTFCGSEYVCIPFFFHLEFITTSAFWYFVVCA